MGQESREEHGALVGWKGQNLGSNLILQVESLTRTPEAGGDERRCFRYVMNKQQAAQLGQYLFEVSGQTAPRRKRGWLSRMLGI